MSYFNFIDYGKYTEQFAGREETLTTTEKLEIIWISIMKFMGFVVDTTISLAIVAITLFIISLLVDMVIMSIQKRREFRVFRFWRQVGSWFYYKFIYQL